MRAPLRLPWAFLTATVALIAVGGGLALSASPPDPGYLALDASVGLSCAAVGALVRSRRPRQPIGWLFAVGGLGLAMQAATGGFAVAAQVRGWPLSDLAFWLTNWVFFIGLGPLLAVPMLLPDGRLPSPSWRPVLGLHGVLGAVLTVILMLRDEAWAWGVVVERPLGDLSTLSTSEVVAPAFGAVMVAFAATGAAAVATRLRHRDEADRRQLYPVLGAAMAVAAAIAIDAVLPPDPPVGIWLVALSLTLLPIAVAFAVLRHRLFEIELVVRRTLVYAVASALLLVVYVGVVSLVDVPAVGAAVVAVAFAPVRDLVQRWLAHLLFGDRGDPRTALAALGRRLEDASDTPLADAARVVAVTLRLPGAALVDDSGRVVSAHGRTRPDGVSVPLVAGGRVEGELRAARRSPGEELSPADRAVLAELARPLALGLAGRRLDAELARSRELLVSAREEERRRLRRELHDGLGPGLAAIGMELDLALAMRGGADDVAAQSTTRARELVGTLIGDVRRVVHELRPGALDELGLAGALEDLALTPGAGPRVDVVAGPLPELPAAVEVAAYRIAQEALANAVRHAEASTVRITVSVDGPVDDGCLHLRVEDDGRGIGADVVEGVGSGSMRERAAEVGGRYVRAPRPGGGTIVRADLPL